MDKTAAIERARHFRSLHARDRILLLPNAWDAGSARLFAQQGFAAIATTSGGMAWSLGQADGEQLPRDEVIAASRRIVAATQLPVSVDFEGGYGDDARAVQANVAALIETGIAGLNLEDGIAHHTLRDIDDAAARIAAARAAALASGVPIFINARIDCWMIDGFGSEAQRIVETQRRARAYLAAGADGIYPIGVTAADTIATLCAGIDAPINLGARPGLPALDELARLGVARLSTATRLATLAYAAARDAALALRESGRCEALDAHWTYADMQQLFAPV